MGIGGWVKPEVNHVSVVDIYGEGLYVFRIELFDDKFGLHWNIVVISALTHTGFPQLFTYSLGHL